MLEAMLLAGRKNDTLLARGYDNQSVSFLNIGAFNRGNDAETWNAQAGANARPPAIDIDFRGYIYAGFINTPNSVIKYNTLGEVQLTIDPGQQPLGLAVDPDGFIYVSGGGALKKYSSTGAQQWDRSMPGGQIVLDYANGALYLNQTSSTSYTVRRVALSSGNTVWSEPRFSEDKEMAVDSAGNVYGLLGTALRKLNSNGAILWTSPALGGNPRGVTVDEDDFIYVANSDGGGGARLHKYDTAGNEIYNVSTGTITPYSTTVDDKGLIYIAQASSGGLTQTRIHDAETGAFVQQLTYPAISGSPNTSRIAVYQRWRQ